ncbi:MAG: hypothetical protein FWD40_10065, partial [Treponema sp.]|nr:hypothetical protein [Treponema sp.]
MFEKLLNPDNVPKEVTSGYQRQNTNIYAIQMGIDTTEPYDNGAGIITIPAGDIVEMNGAMFKIITTITLPKPDPSIAYWIAISDNGNASLVT